MNEPGRYLIDFDTEKIESEYQDVVIIGSGIAGVYSALVIAEQYHVCILTKETIDTSNSVLAQGGIAVSLDKEDSPALHFKDTVYAGAGLCDEENVWVLVKEAAQNILALCQWGVNFDRNDVKALSLTREGAHSMNRIIHAGDTTGKEVFDTLISVVKTRPNVEIRERFFVLDLITEDGCAKGVLIFDEDTKKHKIIYAKAVICATGGFGQLYQNTTNPEVATGDGVSLAYRAGAELTDLEFIQFHPTVLYHPQNRHFLISEALRGEGAMLLNEKGERFMPKYHELAELAPRDVVSRAIFAEISKTGTSNVYLDLRFKGKEYLENRFPNIYKTCLEYGIDLSKDLIPVAPAEHYCMGGIRTDVFGRTNIQYFFACGEAACSGIHGANRLASNSLLEGLVFGYKIADEVNRVMSERPEMDTVFQMKYSRNADNAIKQQVSDSHCGEISRSEKLYKQTENKGLDIAAIKADIQRIMTEYVGMIRDGIGLEKAKTLLTEHASIIMDMKNETLLHYEVQNILTLAILVVESALEREESRGAHYRSDFNKTDDEKWKRHIYKKRSNNNE